MPVPKKGKNIGRIKQGLGGMNCVLDLGEGSIKRGHTGNKYKSIRFKKQKA